MNNYELMVIVKPDIGMDDIDKRLKEIKELVTSQKGEIYFEDLWGIKDFSYKIKKYDRGYYAVYNFKLNPRSIKEFDKTLRLENDVIRHMIISLPEGYEAKSYLQMEEEAKKQEEEDEKTRKPKRTAGGAPVTAKKEVPKEKEAKEEVAVKEEKAKPKETSMEDVDAKLKSIIDNPDLNF
jgi:small subunit ribosomal protein S6